MNLVAEPGSSRPLSIAIVAAEESGDALGASLAQALRRLQSASLEFTGVGGRAMAAAGIHSPFPIDELSIIGLTAIPRRLPQIFRRISETVDAVVAARPDVLVVIDSPDFTHRVARRVRRLAPSIPIIDYVSPSVWAWRPGRARAMRAYVDHVLAILPFEPAILAELGGPPCTYVGHPLIERIAELRPNAAEAQRRLADPPLVLALPGSRSSEIRRLAGIFGEAIERLAARVGAIDLVIPTVPNIAAQLRAAVAGWAVAPRIVVDTADKWSAFRNARVALAASGTVTLELALAGRADGRGLSPACCRGHGRPPHSASLETAQRHPRQSGAPRKRGAGVPASRLHAGKPGCSPLAALPRHRGAPPPDRRLPSS